MCLFLWISWNSVFIGSSNYTVKKDRMTIDPAGMKYSEAVVQKCSNNYVKIYLERAHCDSKRNLKITQVDSAIVAAESYSSSCHSGHFCQHKKKTQINRVWECSTRSNRSGDDHLARTWVLLGRGSEKNSIHDQPRSRNCCAINV